MNKYGTLLGNDIKLYRKYFDEMVNLIGIKVGYRSPKPDKHYTTYAEIESNYNPLIEIGCIFDEHPTQQTLKKMGWVSELSPSASLIHIAYDTPNIQQGALFILPSGIDDAKGRLFRVVKLSNGVVYPASLTCELVPEYEDTYVNDLNNFSHTSFNLLTPEEDNIDR
ncbi:MAG: hypothetical protein J6J33_04815 [Clostridia bacterium]|nr:hypothetical protein [Clostridia bacterium]